MENSENFAAPGVEIDIALAKQAAQRTEPHLVEWLGAMGAERLYIVLFFQADHFPTYASPVKALPS